MGRRGRPSLLILARHGAHRIEGTDLGSQAHNLLRQSNANILLIGTTEVRPEEIPWIEEDGEMGLEWAPEAEFASCAFRPSPRHRRKAVRNTCWRTGARRKGVPALRQRIQRRQRSARERSPGTQGRIQRSRTPGAGARRDTGATLPMVTSEWLDEAIAKLLPTHMQLIMGIGTAEELALAEVKAGEAMKRTVVQGSDADAVSASPTIEATCPYTGHVHERARTAADPVVWTEEAFDRLGAVPLIARPLARNTVERFARDHDFWRITTRVMDENKQAMIEADTFDADTMLVMFRELQTKQLKLRPRASTE